MISGFTVARNVVKLKYPMVECIESLVAVCDEVVLSIDPTTEDGTFQLAREIEQQHSSVRLMESKWDMENRNAGTEIGIQTQLAMNECTHPWTLYCQLDEAMHEEDRDALHALLAVNPQVTGYSFVRPYFWQNLQTIRKDWSPSVTRLVRQDTHDYAVLDGHSCKTLSGRVEPSNLWMYHYSRLGDPQDISQRVRTLDGLFHAEDTLIPKDELPDYDWGTRQWDNFSTVENPPVVDAEFVRYDGTHPAPFAQLHKDTVND